LNDFISGSKMLGKQFSFIFVHEIDDLVVVPDHDHRILPQNSQSFLVVHDKIVSFVGDSDVEGNQDLPGGDFVQKFHELSVEVTLDVPFFGLQQVIA